MAAPVHALLVIPDRPTGLGSHVVDLYSPRAMRRQYSIAARATASPVSSILYSILELGLEGTTDTDVYENSNNGCDYLKDEQYRVILWFHISLSPSYSLNNREDLHRNFTYCFGRIRVGHSGLFTPCIDRFPSCLSTCRSTGASWGLTRSPDVTSFRSLLDECAVH